MAKTQTNVPLPVRPDTDDLRRALLYVIGAVDRLREIAGAFPLIEQDLRAARTLLGDRPNDDRDQKPGTG